MVTSRISFSQSNLSAPSQTAQSNPKSPVKSLTGLVEYYISTISRDDDEGWPDCCSYACGAMTIVCGVLTTCLVNSGAGVRSSRYSQEKTILKLSIGRKIHFGLRIVRVMIRVGSGLEWKVKGHDRVRVRISIRMIRFGLGKRLGLGLGYAKKTFLRSNCDDRIRLG